MDNTSVAAQSETERQDALITEIAPLARELAMQYARRRPWEDLAQDVMLECVEQIRAGKWPSHLASLPAYINTIVGRRASNRGRNDRCAAGGRKKYMAAVVASERAWMLPSVDQEQRDVAEAVRDALMHMNVRCLIVYNAIRDQMMSIEDTAAAFGMSRNSVVARLRRADCAIRAELLACGLLPEGTRATPRMLANAHALVPAVLVRRARERKWREKNDLERRSRKQLAAVKPVPSAPVAAGESAVEDSE